MKMKKHLTRARIIGYILLFCAVTMTILPSTLARYRTRIEGGAVASVALWGSGSSEFQIDINGMKPGNDSAQQYEFVVTNTKEGQISEVGQNYSITVETTDNLPLKFTLSAKAESGSSGLGNTVNTGILSFSDGKAVLEGGFLPHSVETKHTYVLTVLLPVSNAEYADEIDLITVTVQAEQTPPVSP